MHTQKHVEIIPFQKKYTDTWESIVHASNNGTIYHTQKFLNYHPKDRFDNFHHLISVGGKICSVIPGAIIESEAGKTFVSYPGASFAGFVLPETFGLEDTDQVVSAFLRYLEEQGFKRIDITGTPFIFSARQNQHIDFILSREGFGFKKREMTSVVTLPGQGTDILASFKDGCRRSIKKAIARGVTVRVNDSDQAYHAYYHILKNNLELRHNVKPAHSLDEMIDIKKRFPDDVFLFAAYIEHKMIAGIWLIRANSRVSVPFYISHNHEHQELRPINLLYYEVIKQGLEWNQKYLDFGLFTVNMAPNYGLGRFKENFGAQGMFRDYFRKDYR